MVTACGQALALEADERDSNAETQTTASFFEVTIAAKDQPMLLSRLTEALVRVLEDLRVMEGRLGKGISEEGRGWRGWRLAWSDVQLNSRSFFSGKTAEFLWAEHTGGARVQHSGQVLPGCVCGRWMGRPGNSMPWPGRFRAYVA